MSQYIGPWIVDSDVPKSDIGYRAIISLDGDTICNPSPMGGRNAKLIAAPSQRPSRDRAVATAQKARCHGSSACS